MATILVVEDDRDIAQLLAFNLEKEGHTAVVVHDGIAALDEAARLNPDLVLLDLMLPGLRGGEVCRLLKTGEKTAAVPVIMVTAKGEEIDKVTGLEMGADDYVVKPFSMRELLLRVRALLRRSNMQAPRNTAIMTVGPLTIDTVAHRVSVEGAEVVLTAMEFKLLQILGQRAGRVQSREELLREVWGYRCFDDTRTVDTHVTRLRSKLGCAGQLIKTIRGFGYKMTVKEEVKETK